MKKVGRYSDLYTSRGPVRHRGITKRFKTAVDVFVMPEDSVRNFIFSLDGDK